MSGTPLPLICCFVLCDIAKPVIAMPMAQFQHHISHQAVGDRLPINAKLASISDTSALLIKHATCTIQAMQVQNMVWAPAVITVLTALANVPINMILIAWYDFWGAALATSVARILQLALLCGKLSTQSVVSVSFVSVGFVSYDVVSVAWQQLMLLQACCVSCRF